MSTFICAVREDRRQEASDADDDEIKYAFFFASPFSPACDSRSRRRYSTFVRIGTGFSFADYVWIRQKPWKEWDPKRPPSFLITAKRGQDDKGDVYLEPEECVLLDAPCGRQKR